MDFSNLKHKLLKLKNKSLPGLKGQLKLAPPSRVKSSEENFNQKKDAAVSICLFPDSNQKTRILFILRNSYKGVHSNQISFPGGKKEKFDYNLIDTAKRETHEEIGLNIDLMKFHFKLTKLYIPPSNFLVRPFVFTLKSEPLFSIDKKEVSKILYPKISDLLDMKIHYGPDKNMNENNPYFLIENHVVWGATAMILNEFLTMLK
tara:strand:+ start:2351 stop:2962 length:612 start_codon:yes stop_codon:yes gene_type:complete